MYDGDSLTALTYGVDDIARALGVLESLPCLVLLDALPEGQISVVPLHQADFSQLFAIIRQVLHELIEESKFRTYISSIEEIAHTEKALPNLEAQLSELERRQAQMPQMKKIENSTVHAYESAADAVAQGATKQFGKILHTLPVLSSGEIRLASEKAGRLHAELIRFDRTIRTLTHYLTEQQWPLVGVTRDRYAEAIEKYAVGLVSNSIIPLSLESPAQCEEILRELRARHQAMVDEILSLLPPIDSVIQRALAIQQERRVALDLRTDQVRNTIRELSEQRSLAVRACLAAEHPSLASLFARISKRKKLIVTRRNIGATVSQFGRSMFSPNTLLEIAKFIHDL